MADGRRFSQGDLQFIADFVVAEMKRRKDNPFRRDKELEWAEIDRQVKLLPKKVKPRETTVQPSAEANWMPQGEFPSQANALGIITDDVHRMIFTEGDEWYEANALLTPEYVEGVLGLSMVSATDVPIESPDDVDQVTVDMTAKAAMEHYRKLYDYRLAWFQPFGEGIKYGTYIPRIRLVKRSAGTAEYRGEDSKDVLIPMVVPASIRNVYLDDRPQWVLHDSLVMGPSYIRRWWQSLEGLQRAARDGGAGRGWKLGQISNLVPQELKGHKNQIGIIEYEGDIFLPRSRGPDELVRGYTFLVAVGQGVGTVRVVKNELPFCSYLTGYYDKFEVLDPYGSSPLTRGRTLQDVLSEAMNRSLAAAALQAEPPISWDSEDTSLQEQGGPQIVPGTQWMSQYPDKIKAHLFGDPSALLAIVQMYNALFEQNSGVNDPRRGAEGKSHTTGFAKDVEVTRSLLPTESFATRVISGPLLSMQYMEYEAVKIALRTTTTMFIDSRGDRGHVEMTPRHLPAKVDFVVKGSRGVLTKRELRDNFIAFMTAIIQIEQIEAQTQVPHQEIKRRLAQVYEIEDADEIIGTGDAVALRSAEQSAGEGGSGEALRAIAGGTGL